MDYIYIIGAVVVVVVVVVVATTKTNNSVLQYWHDNIAIVAACSCWFSRACYIHLQQQQQQQRLWAWLRVFACNM